MARRKRGCDRSTTRSMQRALNGILSVWFDMIVLAPSRHQLAPTSSQVACSAATRDSHQSRPRSTHQRHALEVRARTRAVPVSVRAATRSPPPRGELTAEVFRRSVQQFGLRLSNPELEALMRKYRTHSGLIDYIRFIQCIGQTQK